MEESKLEEHNQNPQRMEDQPQRMDIVGSLRKIARELADLRNETDPNKYMETVSGAAYLIGYIADGLEKELTLAESRAWRLRFNELNRGQALDNWDF